MPVITNSTALFNPFSPLTRVNPPGIDGTGAAYDADVAISANQPVGATAAGTGQAFDATVSTNTLPAGMTSLALDEQWASIDSTKWGNAADGTTYGAQSVGYWRAQNTVVAAATSGGSGNSLQLTSKRESFGGRSFTCGMVSSKTASTPRYYPIFGRYEVKMKMPAHGQGVWPAVWLRHRNGSSICEVDIMELFHVEEPGHFRMTLHSTDNAGVFKSNRNLTRYFVEEPTAAPGWNTVATEILNEGSGIVRFKGYLNGTLIWNYLDTQATLWSVTQGTSHPSGNGGQNIFDICIQGSQISGNYVCHPDDPRGYSRARDACILGGTKPNACSIVGYGGRSVRNDTIDYAGTLFPNTFEVDYVKVWSAI